MLDHFFYGVNKQKYLKIYFNNKLLKKIKFEDINQFEFIFNQGLSFFKKNQLSNTDNFRQLNLLNKMEYLYNKCLTT